MAGVGSARFVERDQRDREVVQRTAELLSSNLSLEELFAALCELLARFIDGPSIFIALRDGEGARYRFLLENGTVGQLQNKYVVPGSCADLVLRSGRSLLKRRIQDWTEGRVAVGFATQPGAITSVSGMFVPLKYGSEVIGVLSVQTPAERAYDERDLSLLETCALYLSVRIQQANVESKSARLADIASTDSLTGVRNRRSFDERLCEEWRRAARSAESLSAIIIDVDFFKAFNDSYGHIAGDSALTQVAGALQSCVNRAEDVFARYGGEEFVAVLPATQVDGAVVVAERMRAAVLALQIPHAGSQLGYVSVSIGVASMKPARGIERADLLRKADSALYNAKSHGRNRVVAEGYRSQSRPAIVAGARRETLPLVHGTCFCDAGEIEAVRKLSRVATLVTLIGPVGIGKSRLAIECAMRESRRYPDGVFYVDCSTIAEECYLADKIARVVGVAETPMVAADSALALFLQSKRALIVVDNCDSVADAVTEYLRAMLAQTQRVRILATCRRPLNIEMEVALHMRRRTLEESFDLLVERSGITDHGGELQNLRDLSEALGRLPRALELAAAQLQTTRVDDIIARLPVGAALELEAANGFVHWSYDALEPSEQRLLRQLSVFVGGASREGIESVCMDAAALEGLRRKALVTEHTGPDGCRYFIPAAIREFAVEQAIACRDWDESCMHHARYYCDRARAIGTGSSPWKAHETTLELFAEIDNLRAALTYTIRDRADLELGADLVFSLIVFWLFSSSHAEGTEWVEMLFERGADRIDTRTRGNLFFARSALDYARTPACTESALRAAELYREIGDDHGVCRALSEAMMGCAALGDYDRAIELFRESAAIAERIGDERLVAYGLSGMGLIEHYRGNVESSRTYLEQSLQVHRKIGHERGAAAQLGNLGDLAATCGDYDAAVEYTRQGLALQERLHHRAATAWLLTNLGAFEFKRGNVEAARPALYRGLQMAQDSQNSWLIHCALDYIARIALGLHDWQSALQLVGHANALLAALSLQRQPSDRLDYETVVQRCTDAIGAEAAEAELARGYHATRHEMLNLAMKV